MYYYICQCHVTNGEGKVQDKSKMSTRYFSPSSLLFLFWESRCIALPYFHYFILFYFLETVGKTFCSLSSHYISLDELKFQNSSMSKEILRLKDIDSLYFKKYITLIVEVELTTLSASQFLAVTFY